MFMFLVLTVRFVLLLCLLFTEPFTVGLPGGPNSGVKVEIKRRWDYKIL